MQLYLSHKEGSFRKIVKSNLYKLCSLALTEPLLSWVIFSRGLSEHQTPWTKRTSIKPSMWTRAPLKMRSRKHTSSSQRSSILMLTKLPRPRRNLQPLTKLMRLWAMRAKEEYTIKRAWLEMNNSKLEDHSGKVVSEALKDSQVLKVSMMHSGKEARAREVQDKEIILSAIYLRNSRKCSAVVADKLVGLLEGLLSSKLRVKTLW